MLIWSRRVCVTLLGLSAAAQPGLAQTASPHAPSTTVQASRTSRSPLIDGRLVEDCWLAAVPVSSFTQRDPREGEPATERTEVRVVYDETAIYVGARMYDRAPAGIGRRLSARDEEADADQFGVLLDPRHDHLTGAGFVVSAAGVQRDFALSNDTNEDGSWDAVWAAAVTVDEQGWTAELRIPFSQLRFSAADRQTWGINLARYIRRTKELVWLEMVPKHEHGEASRMAHLTGIEHLRSPRHLEVVPYVAGRPEYVQPSRPGDPFNDGSQLFGSVGVDLKASMPRGLTLDASVNPDFGQAEVDPAVVNLSAFETFFQEKRRFFIEGAEIFNNFGARGTDFGFGFNNSDPALFYSRRIGRPPAGDAAGAFVERPRASTILGAARLTGKTPSGWSLGFIEAVTAREYAQVIDDGTRRRVEIEPLTNYAVARVQRDFRRGAIGVLATSVVRSFTSGTLADALPGQATVIGADGFVYLDGRRDWVINAKFSGSRVSGTAAAIAALQRAPQRYYQRPDRRAGLFDPTRTSLSGFTGRTNLARNNGTWRVHATLWGVSPGFDSNDLGFHGTGDRFGAHGVLLWRDTSPGRIARERYAWVARAAAWTFSREITSNLWFGCGNLQFMNYWGLEACGATFARTFDDQLTRGGPMAATPASRFGVVSLESDGRQPLSFGLGIDVGGDDAGSRSSSLNLSARLKPSSSLTVSIGPQVQHARSFAQYTTSETDPMAVDTFGRRDVFARLQQTQVRLETRVNYILTPRASLQLFIEPLLASGRYRGFKQLARPRTFDFVEYGGSDGSLIDFDGAANRYTVDPDGAGLASPFAFDNPDFNYKSFKANAVLRWEFKPGSTFYLVWTQQREDDRYPGQFAFRRDARALFAAHADDIVLMKVSYWIGR